VQLELNRDISTLADEMRVFTIVLVPALLTVLAIVMGIVQRRRRARFGDEGADGRPAGWGGDSSDSWWLVFRHSHETGRTNGSIAGATHVPRSGAQS